MDPNFLTQTEFLQAISRGLQTDVQTVQLFFFIIIGAVLVFVVMGRVYGWSQSKKEAAAALTVFNRKVRKLDLTVNEVDFLDLLSQFLKKPWKKHLLVTNQKTFVSTLVQVKEKDPDSLRLDLARSISRKAGFEISSLPADKRGTGKVNPGAPIRVVGTGGSLYAGEVVQVGDSSFEFRTDALLPIDLEEISVFMIDFSGIQGYTTRITSRKEGNRYTALHSDTPVALSWEHPGKSGVDDEVYIISRESGENPVRGNLKSVRPGWMIIEGLERQCRKGEDVRMFLSKKASGGFWVNGEVYRISRSGRQIMVRLNHVKG